MVMAPGGVHPADENMDEEGIMDSGEEGERARPGVVGTAIKEARELVLLLRWW